MKTYVIVDDGGHNGFPDLTYWRGYFYLAFRAAKNHVDQNSSIKILRSGDAQHWEFVAEMSLDEDIRDPKFALIHETLFLYVLRTRNKNLDVMPYTTIFSTSADGCNWTKWQDVSPVNWVFWRPKTEDGKVWYVAADDRKTKRSALFSSTDGMNWSKVSMIYDGEFNAEIELAFLANKDLLCTIRVQGLTGNPRTLIGQSAYPYKTWNLVSSYLTRLDGACSFTYHDQVFSAGRFEPKPRFKMGSYLNQKRTSLFHIKPNEIVWLSNLPSSGDTGYTSVVILDGIAYIVYYTNDPGQDYRWVMGQFKPTQIWMVQIDLSRLEYLSKNR